MNEPLCEPDYTNIADSPFYSMSREMPLPEFSPVSTPFYSETPAFLALCIDYLKWIEALPPTEQKQVCQRHWTVGSIGPDFRRLDKFHITVLGRTLSVTVSIDVAEWIDALAFHGEALLYLSLAREVRCEAERKLLECS